MVDRLSPGFKPLNGIYEPSAIQQLPDGRFLVVEDEKQYPFSLLTIAADGSASSAPLPVVGTDAGDNLGKLDDLEALALDGSGQIYAITSHSPDGDGDVKKSRNKLVRFRIDGDRIVAPQVVKTLRAALAAAHPVLAAAGEVADVKADGGLNIEAMEVAPDRQRLLIGFRSPLVDGRAIIASVENLAAMFDTGEAPRISAMLNTLDLDGDGIRGMAHVPVLGGYLLVAGPGAKRKVQFRLWFWNGYHGDPARPVNVPGLSGMEHAEGVCPAKIDGRDVIVIVSDDGDRESGRHARFLLIDPAALRISL